MENTPVKKILLDTDIGSDIDDAVCLCASPPASLSASPP